MANYKELLFRPFDFIAGTRAMAIGLIAITFTGLIGYFSGVSFNGVLDLHFLETRYSIASHLLEGYINWLTLSVFLLISGSIFSKTNFRIIDVFGTQALARWPLVILAALAFFIPIEKTSAFIMEKATGNEAVAIPETSEFILIGLFLLLTLLVVIWMVGLMYKGYSISFNLKGTTAIITFIVALILAEIASKFLVALLYKNIG